MSFSLDHWRENPRHAIATKFEHNDMAYATQGAILALDVLDKLQLSYPLCKQYSILDYGCGTGRVSRILARMFKTVVGYDPVKECLDLAFKECLDLPFTNVLYTDDVKGQFDYICCINVFEHLNSENEMICFGSIIKHLKVGGKAVIWYHSSKNQLLAEHFGRLEEGVNIGVYTKS